ncbi:hypothetical protein GOBAR_DD27499 [Gossypium barbadense]|nr:hypothetical protein GOBAR_DD27499 [Gossypium barbadense]
MSQEPVFHYDVEDEAFDETYVKSQLRTSGGFSGCSTVPNSFVSNDFYVAPHLCRWSFRVANPFTSVGDGFGCIDGSGLHVGPGHVPLPFAPGLESSFGLHATAVGRPNEHGSRVTDFRPNASTGRPAEYGLYGCPYEFGPQANNVSHGPISNPPQRIVTPEGIMRVTNGRYQCKLLHHLRRNNAARTARRSGANAQQTTLHFGFQASASTNLKAPSITCPYPPSNPIDKEKVTTLTLATKSGSSSSNRKMKNNDDFDDPLIRNIVYA